MSYFVKSRQGKKKLVAEDAYIYIIDRERAGKMYWRCEVKSCKGRVHTRHGSPEVIHTGSGHHHAPVPGRGQALRVVSQMKDHAETSHSDPPRNIIASMEILPTPVAAQVPKISNLSQTIRRHRNKVLDVPKDPSTRTGFQVPDEYTETTDGKQFLAHDSGSDDPSRILIFASPDGLQLLDRSQHLLGDGTFRTSPRAFFQIFTVQAIHKGHYIPVLSCLLPDKKEETYTRLFTEMRRLCPNLDPSSFSCDLERAIINSIKRIYPNVQVYLCYFHFKQCLWRKIQELGWQARYASDHDFALSCRKVAALAFLPVDDVSEGFELLQDEEELDALLDYVEPTYIGRRRGRNGRREAPTYRVEDWNVRERTLNGQHRTNNASEGLHNAMAGCIGVAHPGLYKLIKQFKKEENLARRKVLEANIGNARLQDKKYVTKESNLLALVTDYNPDDKLAYLESIAMITFY